MAGVRFKVASAQATMGAFSEDGEAPVVTSYDACFVVHRYLNGRHADDAQHSKARALGAFAVWCAPPHLGETGGLDRVGKQRCTGCDVFAETGVAWQGSSIVELRPER